MGNPGRLSGRREVTVFAVLIAEILNWEEHCARRTITVFVAVAAVAGVMTRFQPTVIAVGIAALMLWLGWLSGVEYRRPQAGRNPVQARPVSRLAGKLGSLALLGSAHLLMLSPILVLMALTWGPPVRYFAELSAAWLLSSFTAAALSVISRRIFGPKAPYAGSLLIIVWIALTFQFHSVVALNPFLLVSGLLSADGEGQFLRGLAGELGGTAVLALVAALAVRLRKEL
jgi:hypothetical protein